MAEKTLHHVPWRRFHDPKNKPKRSDVADVLCADEAADFIDICQKRPATGLKLKAAGSHWSLSDSTLSDDSALETNWPDAGAVPRNSGLAVDMLTIISDPLFNFMTHTSPVAPDAAKQDPCLTAGASNCFFVHLKSGTRVYEAYSLLDGMAAAPTDLAKELNKKITGDPVIGPYSVPWGFMTLGGAGGQTVFGALTTGTHGGDFRQRPIADAVVAMHLVTDGGDHFWVERASSTIEFPIADDSKLQSVYGNLNSTVSFKIVRDNDLFDAVVVGVGRFGVVVSMVLRVVPQYCLLEHRRLADWSLIKAMLKTPARHHAFDTGVFFGSGAATDQAGFARRFGTVATAQNRFLQIAINPSPHLRDEHRVGVTQRWFHPNTAPEAIDPNTGDVRGRRERGIASGNPAGLPETAGTTPSYSPQDDPSGSGSSSGNFLDHACSDGNFIAGIVREAAKEIEKIITNNAVTAGGIAAAAFALGAGAEVLAIASVCAVLAAVALALEALADAIDALGDASLAQTVQTVIDTIEDIPGVPQSIKIMLLRLIVKLLFEEQQKDHDYVAISYAVMDGHDYVDRSCFGNAESIEIFFDAARPDIYCAFVDAALAFEAAQEEQAGRFTAGYISLRYMLGSRGLIAPSQFDETVAIEISGLRDAKGSVPFIMNAVELARDPMFRGLFHWGQFNPLTRPEVEALYDLAPGKHLTRWRHALQKFTRNGAMDGFSSAFTIKTGLEPF
jgi:hypothetical protein